jgi:hypothetical protein
MLHRKAALVAGLHYLKKHPEELLHSARRARHLRIAIPVAALKWLASDMTAGATGPREVQIASSPPGFRVNAMIEQMSTLISASCVLLVERVTVGTGSLELELRLKDVKLELADPSTQTALAALIRSQTLDLSRVASLVAYLPSRPEALVEAVDDRLVFDLMKLPQLVGDTRIRRILGVISGVLAVDSVCVDSEHLEIKFRHLPGGIRSILKRRP